MSDSERRGDAVMDKEPSMGDHAGHAAHGSQAAQSGGHDANGDHAAVFRRKFWLTLVLTVPVVAYSHMLMQLTGWTLPSFPGSKLAAPVLGTVVFLYGGRVFLAGGWAEARSRRPGMMLLISLGIIVAFGGSLATSLGLLNVDLWPELSTLVTIMLLGHWLELRSLGQAQGALAALAALLPDEAERFGRNGELETVPVSELAPGDVVLVRPGGRVPADGTIVEGSAELDESMITGESAPVPKGPRDRVVAGTVSTDSSIRVRVEAVGDDTALAGIQRLIADAQASRSRAQALADRAAALLFYVATASGAATFIVWWALGDLNAAFVRTVTVLVIACPHALGLAIPLVISISTSVAARAGILVKDRLALERMRNIDAVLFDKTGTLTKGRPALSGIAATGIAEDELLALAASAEAESEHPLARAIVDAARERGLEVAPASSFRAVTGRGVKANVRGREVAVAALPCSETRDSRSRPSWSPPSPNGSSGGLRSCTSCGTETS